MISLLQSAISISLVIVKQKTREQREMAQFLFEPEFEAKASDFKVTLYHYILLGIAS